LSQKRPSRDISDTVVNPSTGLQSRFVSHETLPLSLRHFRQAPAPRRASSSATPPGKSRSARRTPA
jgi:hypothetical protein